MAKQGEIKVVLTVPLWATVALRLWVWVLWLVQVTCPACIDMEQEVARAADWYVRRLVVRAVRP